MTFKDLSISIKYKTLVNNPIINFYVPVLSKSLAYKRAVGYFSSAILIDYTKGLREFLKNSGTIQLIISPYLTNQDIESINLVYTEEITKERINELFISYINDEKSFASAKLLFLLIKLGRMEIKVAEPRRTSGLFHDKIGLFYDHHNNKIAINGSNNETSSSVNRNAESFTTFCSWKDGQEIYVEEHERDFEKYWVGEDATIKIYSLEKALDENIIKKFETDETYEDLIALINDEIIEESKDFSVKPYKFQKDAVDRWFDTKEGIFKFATGSGKTKTAIYLMERLEREKNKNFFVIVVPDKTLVNQWSAELERHNKKNVKCYSANSNWHNDLKNIIDISSIQDKYDYYIVVTNDSFNGIKFKRELNKLNNEYLLVVDECHTWGTENMLSNLPTPKMKLGLSATPELFFSEEKTERLLNFFGGIIAEYSLADAIRDGYLVDYEYYPHFVTLTEDECLKYDELTKKIVKRIGYDVDDMNDSIVSYEGVELLLFARARIVYGAINKLNELEKIIPDLAAKKNLIVYCGPTSYSIETQNEAEKESLTQLQAVNQLLGNLDLKFAQYTSQESEEDREYAINSFMAGDYSTLVAIKCLDEGVNIPQIQRAIIMASSTNPREFIQRRGRILRTFPGKKYSEIHDFVVFDKRYERLCRKEIARVAEFLTLASNAKDIFNTFNDLQKQFYWEEVYDGI